MSCGRLGGRGGTREAQGAGRKAVEEAEGAAATGQDCRQGVAQQPCRQVGIYSNSFVDVQNWRFCEKQIVESFWMFKINDFIRNW